MFPSILHPWGLDSWVPFDASVAARLRVLWDHKHGAVNYRTMVDKRCYLGSMRTCTIRVYHSVKSFIRLTLSIDASTFELGSSGLCSVSDVR